MVVQNDRGPEVGMEGWVKMTLTWKITSCLMSYRHSDFCHVDDTASFKISDISTCLKEAFRKSESCMQVFETDTTSTETHKIRQSS